MRVARAIDWIAHASSHNLDEQDAAIAVQLA